MSDWGMPALYFMSGSRSPSPPLLPHEQAAALTTITSSFLPSTTTSLLSPPPFSSAYSSSRSSSPSSCTLLSSHPSLSSCQTSSPSCSPRVVSCVPSSAVCRPVAVRPMSPSSLLSADGLKKAKRKASVTHAIDDTALRHVHLSTSPILLPLLSAAHSHYQLRRRLRRLLSPPFPHSAPSCLCLPLLCLSLLPSSHCLSVSLCGAIRLLSSLRCCFVSSTVALSPPVSILTPRSAATCSPTISAHLSTTQTMSLSLLALSPPLATGCCLWIRRHTMARAVVATPHVTHSGCHVVLVAVRCQPLFYCSAHSSTPTSLTSCTH